MSSDYTSRSGKLRIAQFAPTLEHPHYQGVYGWGFDSHGYRIVVYGPKDKDSWMIEGKERDIARRRLERNLEDIDDNDELSARERSRAYRRAVRRDQRKKYPRTDEHGPAHVHVYHIHSGREAKFELFESHDGNHRVAYLPNGNGGHKRPLTRAEMFAVEPILDSAAGDMIRMWRELHIDNKLSGYVSRIDRLGEHEVISRVQPDGWLEITNGDGRIVREPPPNMEGEPKPGDDDEFPRGRRPPRGGFRR